MYLFLIESQNWCHETIYVTSSKREINLMSEFTFQQAEAQPEMLAASMIGKIKSDNVDQFEALFQQIIKTGKKKIILDFGGLEFLNSKAVGIILRTLGALRKTGGEMVAAKVNPQILQVFQLLTLDKIMKIFGTIQDATVGFQKS